MKTERRHELQTNQLADWLGLRIERLRPYSQAITAGLIAIAAVIMGLLWFSRQASQTQEAAWESYFDAANEPLETHVDRMRDVAQQYPESTAGEMARLSMADVQFGEGVQALYTDTASGRASLEDALASYEDALKFGSADALKARATLGIAKTNESLGKVKPAIEAYRKLVDTWPDSAYASQARERIIDLERQNTREFYDWFAQRSVTPSASSLPGTPGERPPMDLGNWDPTSTPPTSDDTSLTEDSPFRSLDMTPDDSATDGPANDASDVTTPDAATPQTTEPAAANVAPNTQPDSSSPPNEQE